MKASFVLSGLCVVMLAWQLGVTSEAFETLWKHPFSRIGLLAGTLYGFSTGLWCFWRLWLAIRYRPTPIVSEDRLPRISVIVPAFNEGRLVGETLRSLARADYPRDRYQIIVVDDGSTDDTWDYIYAAAEELGSIITPVRCMKNRGKRWALWEGFCRANGEIFVTVDSDSLVEPDALRALVSPMVEDPDVGGVAGNVRVLNRADGLVPRMMVVRYVMTFDYKRAAQSMMGGGAVLCCAGALAAYRRSAVLPVLDQWLHQTFRGRPARAGEDHAMTNFILSQGLKVRYQRSARVRTNTPSSYVGLCKMFLRWGRSNIRETIHTASYVFGNFRPNGKLGIRFNFMMGAMGLVMPYVFLVLAFGLALWMPSVFGLKLLAACVYGSMFTVIFTLIRERSTAALFGMPYAFYSTFLLWWIWPYALATCHKSVWLTRTAGPSHEAEGGIPVDCGVEPIPALALAGSHSATASEG